MGVLDALRSGRRDALDDVVAGAYDELRSIAHRHLRARSRGAGDRGCGHVTLSTTAVVHEAYLKLAQHPCGQWNDRAHFLAVASVAMRHVLTDHARARATRKRGGTRARVMLDDEMVADEQQADVVLEIDDALQRLSVVDPRLARVVECRFFGGLSEEETAEVLGVTARTIQRDWKKARMLLRRQLDP